MNTADLKDLVIDLQRENQTLRLQCNEILVGLEDAISIVEMTDEANEPPHDWWVFTHEMKELIARVKGTTNA